MTSFSSSGKGGSTWAAAYEAWSCVTSPSSLSLPPPGYVLVAVCGLVDTLTHAPTGSAAKLELFLQHYSEACALSVTDSEKKRPITEGRETY